MDVEFHHGGKARCVRRSHTGSYWGVLLGGSEYRFWDYSKYRFWDYYRPFLVLFRFWNHSVFGTVLRPYETGPLALLQLQQYRFRYH